MHEIGVIFKKELKRFFSDRRLLIALFLPGLLIFVIYSVMGNFITSMTSAPEGDAIYRVTVFGESQNFSSDLDSVENFKHAMQTYPDEDMAKTALKEKRTDVIVVFPDSFDQKVENGQFPTVRVLFDSSNAASQNAYTTVMAILQARMATPVFGVSSENQLSEEDFTKSIMSSILPLLMLMLLFTGCLSVATESIAGEKERGTIATLLVTPVKRAYIASGKILALSVTALLSATVSFLGVILSLPKLLGQELGSFNLLSYGAGVFLGIFAIILTSVLFFTVIVSIISALCKSVKEATQYSGPAILVIAVTSLLTMYGNLGDSPVLYLIPIFNAAKSLSGLLSGSFNLTGIIITSVENLVLFGLGVFALSKLFDSERIMFNN